LKERKKGRNILIFFAPYKVLWINTKQLIDKAQVGVDILVLHRWAP
jgi:uncharacterized lipoprotein